MHLYINQLNEQSKFHRELWSGALMQFKNIILVFFQLSSTLIITSLHIALN